MEQAARAAGIVDNIADPELSPTRDVELGRNPYLNRNNNASRASVPLSHRRSFSTVGGGRKSRADSTRSRASNYADAHTPQRHQDATTAIGTAITTAEPDRHPDERAGDDETANDAAEAEIPWGPEHPCFPHPNPHVPLTSPLYLSTRIIRVKRDWMLAGDLAPTFTTLYPEILDWFPCLSEAAFKDLIKQLNALLVAAFSPWRPRAWLDVLLGAATGWLWDDAGLSGVKTAVADAEAFLERWNTDFGGADGVRIIPLRRTGFLCLDIEIPDPHIVDAADEGRGDGGTEAEGAAERDMDAETDASRRWRDESQSRAASGTGASTRRGSRGSSHSGQSRRTGREEGGPQPVVPPIPSEFLQEGAALAITMEGFRKSVDE